MAETQTVRHADIFPWKDVINKAAWYTSYRETDADGNVIRFIFVPKENTGIGLMTALVTCHQLAISQKHTPGWDSYRISVPVGKEAGQEIDSLYIELKPLGTIKG
jgi:hypothetical protein